MMMVVLLDIIYIVVHYLIMLFNYDELSISVIIYQVQTWWN